MRPLIGHLRHHERRLFDSVCAVTRAGDGGFLFDPDSGEYVESPSTDVYEGPCMVRPTAGAARVVEFGGQAVSLRLYDVTLPADTAVEVEDIVTVTGSPDPGLIGQVMHILDVAFDERQLNRRIVAEDRQ